MTLTRHEAVLEMSHQDAAGAHFELTPDWKAPLVSVDLERWIAMDHPRRIKVTIEPLGPGEAPTFNPDARG